MFDYVKMIELCYGDKELPKKLPDEINTEMTGSQIAEKLNLKTKNEKSLMYYYLKKFNIKAKKEQQKVSEEKSLKIFDEYNNQNISQKKLSKKYNIHQGTISRIVNGRHWATKKYFKKTNYQAAKRKAVSHNGITSKKEGLEIYLNYHETDKTCEQLSKETGYSYSTIYKVVNCDHWTTRHFEDN